MSASNAPPNPGTPRKPLNSPSKATPTNLARYGPRILFGGIAIGVTYALYVTRSPKPLGTPNPPNPLRTPGVKNIEGAYQSGGATDTHTKAYGGTTLGQKENIPRDGDGKYGTGKEAGMQTEGLGADQRAGPVGPGKAFNEMNYKDSKGK